MSGTLPPGTRIPTSMTIGPEGLTIRADEPRGGYYRGLVEGLVLGGTIGTILGLMCAALAWSHLGG